MLSKKTKRTTSRIINNVLRAIPSIPYVYERRSRSLVPYILGAIGAATLGGVAAVMFFSPRTRYRALDTAKDVYGRVSDQFDSMHIGEKLGMRKHAGERIANGLASDVNSDYGPSGF
jgi:hypothetical protein